MEFFHLSCFSLPFKKGCCSRLNTNLIYHRNYLLPSFVNTTGCRSHASKTTMYYFTTTVIFLLEIQKAFVRKNCSWYCDFRAYRKLKYTYTCLQTNQTPSLLHSSSISAWKIMQCVLSYCNDSWCCSAWCRIKIWLHHSFSENLS